MSNLCIRFMVTSLRWRHNECVSVSNHQPHDCLHNRLSGRRSKYTSKYTSKLRVTGLCLGNSPRTGEFPAQMASNAENVSIWWRHHVNCMLGATIKQFPDTEYVITPSWNCIENVLIWCGILNIKVLIPNVCNCLLNCAVSILWSGNGTI